MLPAPGEGGTKVGDRSVAQYAPGAGLKRRTIDQFDVAALDTYQPVVLQAPEPAADAFRRKAQVVGDIGTRHGEPKPVR